MPDNVAIVSLTEGGLFLLCVSLTHAWEEETSVENTPPFDLPIGKCMGHSFNWWLITWKGPTHCGQCHPWAGGLMIYKKAN